MYFENVIISKACRVTQYFPEINKKLAEKLVIIIFFASEYASYVKRLWFIHYEYSQIIAKMKIKWN